MESRNQSRRLCFIEPWQYDGLEICILSCVDPSASGWNLSRALIAAHNDVFARPVNNHVQVLSYPQMLNDLKFQEILCNLGLVLDVNSGRFPTSDEVRQCLNYTLSCRLASFWNVAGPWIVRRQPEKYFLDMDEDDVPFQAVKIDIRNLDEKNLAIWVEGGLIRMMPISPKDLSGMTPEQEEYFREDTNAVVHLKYNQDNRFFYLPKLSVGRLVSVSRQLPTSSPFKDYGELCLYWKDQYGYQMPANETGIVYFNVAFSEDSIVYTYPSCCVFRKAPEQVLTSPTQMNAIVSQFWNDLLPLLGHFPGDVKPDIMPSRTTWMDKLNFDLMVAAMNYEKDHQNDDSIKKQQQGVSKYFSHSFIITSSNSDSSQQKQRQPKKMVDTKISEFFSSKHPNIMVRRSGNKIRFDPTKMIVSPSQPVMPRPSPAVREVMETPGTQHSLFNKPSAGNAINALFPKSLNSSGKPPSRKEIREYAISHNQPEMLYHYELQKILTERKIWYHPKASYKSLVTMVKKHI